MMVALRDEFQALHPNITIEFQGIPAEEMNDRLTTQIAGGNPPDAVFLDQSAVVDFASRNAFVDLSPYVEQSAAVKRDDYVDAFLNAALWEDRCTPCRSTASRPASSTGPTSSRRPASPARRRPGRNCKRPPRR
jgi:hypothetical protein